MDESFASLDPALRTQFGQFVADKVRKQNIPALLISHHEEDKGICYWSGHHMARYHAHRRERGPLELFADDIKHHLRRQQIRNKDHQLAKNAERVDLDHHTHLLICQMNDTC